MTIAASSLTESPNGAAAPAQDSDLTWLKSLKGRGIKVVRVVHADLFGRQRAKQFPIESLPELLDGIAYSKMSLAEDLLGVPVDEANFPELAGHPDLHAFINPSTAVIPPWEPDAVWVLATLQEHGQPSSLCARSQLIAAHTRIGEELGLVAQAAGEPEFYLFEAGGEQELPKPYGRNGVSYTIDRITDPRGVVGRIHRSLAEFGIGVSAVNREFSAGQFEINLHHNDAVTAADQVFLLKTAIKELAIQEGLEAVFMAKPLTGEEGSSLHVHLSLWNRSGENVFATADHGLSGLLRAAIAGVQVHAAALLALASPTVNSFKRLRGEGLSPRSSNFAEDNRFSFVRVPAERGGATRFELRAGDASASAHLLIAGILHAVRDGIARQLAPTAEGTPLPRTLEDAVAALEQDEVLIDGFGEEFIRVYAEIKRREITSYEATVTDWEWNLYHSHI